MSAMRPATLLRLALAGTRTDTLRVALTAFSTALAALAALCALTVLAIEAPAPPGSGSASWSMRYTHALLREPGLRPGVAFTFALMTIPVLALAGQCARIGAPARDRRLAALRLAGATPRQTTAVAAAETGLAAFAGTIAGLGVYFLLRLLLHDPDSHGRLTTPTDVLPSAGVMAAVVFGLPLVAMVVAVATLRRAVLDPLGPTRRVRRRAPRPWPGLLILLGVVAVAVAATFPVLSASEGDGPPIGVVLPLLLGGGICAVTGVVLGTGWISYTVGRVLHRFARRPAALIAARRLQDDPWSGSRAFAALLTAAVFGAGAAAVRAFFVAHREANLAQQRKVDALTGRTGAVPSNSDFYLSTMDLIGAAVTVSLAVATLGLLVAVAEGVVSRRRAHGALVATGVPRRELGRVVAWQAFAPIVPATLLALTVGTLLGRGWSSEYRTGGYTMTTCDGGPALCDTEEAFRENSHQVQVPSVVREAEVPWGDLALYGSLTLALVLCVVGVGVLLLRAGSSVEELRTG